MKVIVDCDPGIDDIYALMITSLAENVEVLAVTVVHGNSTIENCFMNTNLAIQKVFNNGKKPPVYYGSDSPFLFNKAPDFYFGSDGIANTSYDLYKKEIEMLKEEFEREGHSFNNEHAASKIVELVNANPNEITILALGPLTNIALAHKLAQDEENFSKNIKRLVIMGANEPEGFSKYEIFTRANYPEFNFAMDPMAAKIVIEDFKCDKQIVSFDSCLRSFSIHRDEVSKEFEKYLDESGGVHFIERLSISHLYKIAGPIYGFENLFSCDLVAAIFAFYEPELDIERKSVDGLYVEMNDAKLKGLLKVDNQTPNGDGNYKTEIIISINKQQVEGIFKKSLAKLAALDKLNKDSLNCLN